MLQHGKGPERGSTGILQAILRALVWLKDEDRWMWFAIGGAALYLAAHVVAAKLAGRL